MPEPNDHGVYCEDSWTEQIHHKTESGGGWPNVRDAPLPTRQEAIDAAASRLRSIADGPHYHDPSALELRQRDEVLAWCGSHNQMELFA